VNDNPIRWSVFTKPWPDMPLPELGDFVRELGFTGIELPVRPGYPVAPETVETLPQAARILVGLGVTIESIAGPTDEPTIAACAEAGVPIIRTMVRIGEGGYLQTLEDTWRAYDALIPLLDRYGVAIGVQNHCDHWVPNAMGLRYLIERYDPKHFCAVWDAAHNALNGEDPDLALDLVWSHLRMVNLKNAIWRRSNGPDSDVGEWRHEWVSGRQGLASWPWVTSELRKRGYSGPICLTAEYSDHDAVDYLIREDIAFARSLFQGDACQEERKP
jgi:sugar phosphate isomerase/epimerase